MFNWVKTAMLMAAITALFVVIGGMIGGSKGMMLALIVALGMNFFSYWFSDKLVLKMYNAQEVDEASAPQFYRMIRELATRAQLPMPKVYLIDENAPNAFATGRNPEHAAVAATTGILLGSAVGAAFAASMSAAALASWGWRLPFLLGLLVGIAGYFLRRHVIENARLVRRQRPPLIETLSDHWRTVLGFAGLAVFNAVGFYVSFVFLVSWLQNAYGIPPSRALEINTLSMTILVPVVIAAGALSDRLGRKPLLLLTCALGFIGAVPLFLLLNHHSASLALLGQLGFVLIIGLYAGVLPVVLAEAAPAPVRCTAVSLGYNIAFGVIGGLTPLMAAWLIDRSGDEIAPAFLIMAAAAVTFAAIMRFRETYRAPFALGAPKPAAAYA